MSDRRIVRARVGAYGAACVGGLAIPALENGPIISAIFAGGFIIQVVLLSLRESGLTAPERSDFDVVVSVLLAIVAPSLWPAIVMAHLGNCVFLALRVSIWRTVLHGGIGGVVLLVVGIVTDAPSWELMSSTGLVAGVVYVLNGSIIRHSFDATENDLIEVMTGAATLVQEIDLTTGDVIDVTGPVEALVGWTAAEWCAQDARQRTHPDDFADSWIDVKDVYPGCPVDRKSRQLTSGGHWVWLREVGRVSEGPDGHLYLRSLLMDVTALEDAYETIRQHAERDQLTGLSNRFVLIRDIRDRLGRMKIAGDPFALFLFDLDRFKQINDTLGHGFGDEVLIELASRLSSAVRPGDSLARLGGDEFAVVAAGIGSEEEARKLAAEIVAACTRTISADGLALVPAVSVGYVIIDDADLEVESVLRRADLAMYEAKRSSDDDVKTYRPGLGERADREYRLSADIPRALAQGEFELYFQPKYNMRTDKLSGCEGLVRWNHPEYGLLLPDAFLPLVKLSPEASRFTDHVLERGLAFAAHCRRHLGQAVPVSVNISAHALFEEDLPERVQRLLELYNLPARSLMLELTEHDLMDEAAGPPRVLEALAWLGVGISVDDFGTGYSSLRRLRDLPVGEIKIDRSFVAGAATDTGRDRVIIRSIIDLATNLGTSVIGEGVETVAEAEMLLSLGCEEAQGFLFGRPMPADDFLKRYRRTVPPVIGLQGSKYRPARVALRAAAQDTTPHEVTS